MTFLSNVLWTISSTTGFYSWYDAMFIRHPDNLKIEETA